MRRSQDAHARKEWDALPEPPLDVDERPSFWRGCQAEVSTTGQGVAMSEQREQFRRRVEERVARFQGEVDRREWVT
jgi:hypothetical protein